ncbi:MAG: STAS/SEC14 domain-containing protein, partial [Candidatus Latescibacterota bacterium]
FVHVGAVTDDEFLSFYKALYEDTRIDKSFNLLVDLRQAQSYVRSAAALNEFAGFIRRQFEGTTGRPKVAVVAPDDVSFGLARMYEVFSDDVPWEFVVFRAADAALAWLGLSENLLNDLDQDAQPEGSSDSD